MKNKKIIDSWNKIKPSEAAQKRMLNNILDRVHSDSSEITTNVGVAHRATRSNKSDVVINSRDARCASPTNKNRTKKGEINNMIGTKKTKQYWKSWKILAPITAAVFIFCILMIPGLLNRMSNIGGVDELVLINGGQAPVIGAENGSQDPTGDSQPSSYPLTLNRIETQMSASRLPGQFFWHELTAEQSEAILPDLGFISFAIANYLYPDGTLFDVNITEMADDNGGLAMFNDIYVNTRIIIAPQYIFSGVLFDFDAVVSYVYGVPVTAGVFADVGIWGDGVSMFIASFELDGVHYNVTLHDYEAGESGLNRLTELVSILIQNGINNGVDLSVFDNPVIPEMRDDALTFEQAREDETFGAYLPINMPNDFNFESARRMINQNFDGLLVSWHADMPRMDFVSWNVAKATPHDLARVVSVDDREKFDVSLYSMPWFESVPEEIWEYFHNPVFLAEELTLEILQARAYSDGRIRDERMGGIQMGVRMNFSVLYGGVTVTVHTSGITPEQLWEMLPR